MFLLVALATALFAAGLCFVRPTLLEGLDYITIWKPSFQFLTDALKEGRIPLWNPYVHLGRPYLADMPNMTFYPPLYLVCLGQRTGVFLLVWLHCLLGTFGMLKLAGALGAGRWQGCFMAVCLLASGPLMAHWATGQLPYCWAICYVPWVLYGAVRTEEPWQGGRIAFYAGLLALQLLCIPQVFWFSAVGQGVFILARALRLPLREAARDAWRGLCQFGAACLWAAALLAVVLLPFAELIRQSNRQANSPDFVASYDLGWDRLVNLFGPLNAGVAWEMNIFVGTIVVLLGWRGYVGCESETCAACWGCWGWRR